MEKTDIEIERERQKALKAQLQENDHLLSLEQHPALAHYTNLLKEIQSALTVY